MSRSPVRAALLRADIPAVPAATVGLLLLARDVDVSGATGDTFTAAMTVLVFLLPSASLLGSTLANTVETASGLLARAPDDIARERRADAARDALERLLQIAAPLRRAITYTTTAVLLTSAALFEPQGAWRGVSTIELLLAVAIALLIGTALAVLPATWTVLEYRQARDYVEKSLPALAAPRKSPAEPSDVRS
jgi:hypothetical protein